MCAGIRFVLVTDHGWESRRSRVPGNSGLEPGTNFSFHISYRFWARIEGLDSISSAFWRVNFSGLSDSEPSQPVVLKLWGHFLLLNKSAARF